MGPKRSTRYFDGWEDTRPEGRRMAAALRHQTVNAIVDHVLAYPDLLADLSLLLLANLTLTRSYPRRISSAYWKLCGRNLTSEQAQLGRLLDTLYQAPDQETLNAWRGAILERLVYKCVCTRIRQPGDAVYANLDHLTIPRARRRNSNGYSVDVAACFPRLTRVELCACKLRSEHMRDIDLRDFDALGEYLLAVAGEVITSICSLETAESVREETWDRLECYPDVHLITVEDLMCLLDDEKAAYAGSKDLEPGGSEMDEE